MRAPLRELLVSALEPSARAGELAAAPALDEHLARIVAALEADVAFDPSPDLALLAATLATVVEQAETLESALASLARLAVADLYLAAACARGDRKALRWFERSCGPELDRVIARSPGLGLNADEFRQLVLLRLVVAEPERRAKILSYRGQGSLKAWVRVTAARMVIDLSRRPSKLDNAGPALLDQIGDGDDLELDYLRGAYGPQLQAAFTAAVAALSARQRNLLRQRYLHQVSADALAKLYAVHRSTIFVWLEQARLTLLGAVREALAARVPGHELDSVVGALGSRLDLSVRRLLDSRLELELEG
ncbi:hypothetical protein [Enhygromyxa salina]|uniref:DNA-binding regulatory protein n=1 Tax=Enhygromyxa salina TaxID=215803 RepID=A0A2S9XU38_9BACT|nr:hypothetical protein [Enhygromyxa salina]PRP96231.1 hypothetical protein ENSA7_70450 [Enhygromyxa salina]